MAIDFAKFAKSIDWKSNRNSLLYYLTRFIFSFFFPFLLIILSGLKTDMSQYSERNITYSIVQVSLAPHRLGAIIAPNLWGAKVLTFMKLVMNYISHFND